jgi:hypothetical protein
MQRVSISKAMLIVALVAAHLAAPRLLISAFGGRGGNLLLLLVGLLPLVEAHLIGLYLTARRYRLTLKRRDHPSRGMSLVAFCTFNAIALILLIVTGLAAAAHAWDKIIDGCLAIVRLIRDGFHWLGYTHEDFAAVAVLIWGAMMSGPPLLLSLTFGWLFGRYELVITRRRDTDALAAQRVD